MRDPLKGWARKDGALAGTLSFQYAVVGGAGLGLESFEVGQPGQAAQVTRAVDDGLDPRFTDRFTQTIGIATDLARLL